MPLNTYRKLHVRGTPEVLQKFEERLESSLTSGWFRNQKRESEVLQLSSSQLCFEHRQDDGHLLWEVWLARDSGELYDSRILGAHGTEVSKEENNSVLWVAAVIYCIGFFTAYLVAPLFLS